MDLYLRMPGALPEASPGRRVRARLRDQPELPERGDRHQHTRVHDDRVLPGVRDVQGDDDPDGEMLSSWRRSCSALRSSPTRGDGRLQPPVGAPDGGAGRGPPRGVPESACPTRRSCGDGGGSGEGRGDGVPGTCWWRSTRRWPRGRSSGRPSSRNTDRRLPLSRRNDERPGSSTGSS